MVLHRIAKAWVRTLPACASCILAWEDRKASCKLSPRRVIQPYLVTVGEPDADGFIEFYLFGKHHTEIHQRFLIAAVEARQIVHEFVESGVRSSRILWEEM